MILTELGKGWQGALAEELQKPYFFEILRRLEQEVERFKVFPQRDFVFRALREVDFGQVRVVILGQDPYHGPGQAIGFSFAVPNTLAKKPPSLRNIFKEMASDLGVAPSLERSELSGWARQGVLLLNTVLTVREGEPLSHRGIGWETFTDAVIKALDARPEPLVFLLWGAHARQKKALVTQSRHRVIESAHPSPLSAYNGFFGSRPFSQINRQLQEWGQPAIVWENTE